MRCDNSVMTEKHEMIIFWGAGKLGKKILAIFRAYGVEPDAFLDVKVVDGCKDCDGIKVYSPNWIVENNYHLLDIKFFVTCIDCAGIKEYLMSAGVKDEQIVIMDTIGSALDYVMKHGKCIICRRKIESLKSGNQIFFDLENGLALGGVETWCINTAELLIKEDKNVSFLIGKNVFQIPKKDEWKSEEIYNYGENDTYILKTLVEFFLEKQKITIICNFSGLIFAAAVIAKSICNDIGIISIVHSDDIGYYKSYFLMQKYIDKCLVISKMIEKKLLCYGFEKDKIEYLSWYVKCNQENKRSYSKNDEVLRIGYAGRVNVFPKRVDQIIELAYSLRHYNIRWNIAGIGDYLDEAKAIVEDRGLSEKFFFVGNIECEKIADFWRNQDIMISCSEREGHSISQCEAMANGVVPILTDVSGAKDDVISDVNGYIVSIGDIESIKKRIMLLYYNREKIKIMGNMAYETILKNNSCDTILRLWDKLL